MGATSALVARIGEQRMVVPATTIGEVTRLPHLTRVPGLPAWVRGVANVRGQVLAVLDLRPLLGIPSSAAGAAPRPRLLRLESGGIEVGLEVDAVEGVADLDLGHLDPLPPGAVAPELFRGVVSVSGAPVPLLDPAAVVLLRDRLG